MALRLEDKQALVAEVNEVAANALSAIAAEYRGMTVAQMTELRSKARSEGVYVRVVKNTLAKRAIDGTEFECLADSLAGPIILAAVGGLALLGLGAVAPPSFMAHFTVFVLACFVGWQVIWNVTAALHTPLMAVTNAISGIILVGGMLQAGASTSQWAMWLGVIAILFASINVVGGFLVTHRMLKMFRKG